MVRVESHHNKKGVARPRQNQMQRIGVNKLWRKSGMRSNRVSDFSFPGAPSLRSGNPFRRLVGFGALRKADHKTALHFEYM